MEPIWIITWVFATISLTGSSAILLATWWKRHKAPVRSLLQANLLASSFLCGVHLLVLSCFHLQGISMSTMKSGHLEYHRLNLCSIAAFLNTTGTVATSVFSLLGLVHICKEIYKPIQAKGLPYNLSMTLLVFTWIISFVLAGLIYLPYPYFDTILRTMRADQCLVLDSILHDDVTWHYGVAIHVIIPGLLYVASLFLVIFTDIWARCMDTAMSENYELDQAGLRQLWDVGAKVIVISFSWCPLFCAVLLQFSGRTAAHPSSIKWLIFIGSTLHAIVTPLVHVLSSSVKRFCRRNSYDDDILDKMDTPVPTRKARVSVRLSQYIKEGGLLTPKEAVLVTSDISESISALHRIGMIPLNINPDNIFIEQDLTGEIVTTRLTSVPFKPTPDALGDHILENKAAIGELFDFLVKKAAESQDAEPGTRRKSAIRFHSLREYRQRSVKSKLSTKSERRAQDITIKTRSTSVRSKISRKSIWSRKYEQSRASQKSHKSQRKVITSRRFYRTDVETLERQLTVFKEKRLSRTVAVDIPDDIENVPAEEATPYRSKMAPRMSIKELELDRCYSEEWD